MSRFKEFFKNKKDKIVIVLVLVLMFLGLPYFFAIKVIQNSKLREKTTFSIQDTKNLWTELGLEYIDLEISKAYFNGSLYVISEGFDSIDSELEYLRQFKGNENVDKGDDPFNDTLPNGDNAHDVYGIFDITYDIDTDPQNQTIDCYTYKENEKYYLVFYKKDAGHHEKDYNLYDMFGFNDK